MRILVIDPGKHLWGSEKSLVATLPEIVAHNRQVLLLTKPGSPIVEAVKMSGTDVHFEQFSRDSFASVLDRSTMAFDLLRICLENKIEKIYLNQAGLCRIVSPVATLLRLPLIVHVRIVEDIARCEAIAERHRTTLIFNSESMLKRYNTTKKTIKSLCVAYNPIAMGVEDGSESATRAGFCCVGRLSESKGQLKLIEAIHSLYENEKIRIPMDFFGEAPEHLRGFEQRLSDATARIPESEIRFHGYKNDAHKLMSAYKYVVVPSIYEPFGRVVMEAWNAGAVPIASELSGGTAELLLKSGGGILYSDHETESLSLALSHAYSMNEQDHAEYVRKGREWMKSNLSMVAYRKRLTDILF